jgi:hypothetical protein
MPRRDAPARDAHEALGSAAVPVRAAPASPLDTVLNQSIAPSADRRMGRMQDVARRQERQRLRTGAVPRLSATQRMEQRQASREQLNLEVRTQHRLQYAMARRTFDRLKEEILRDGRYLGSSGVLAEYSYWNLYFQSATAMDGHTFQRFTFWHSRVTQKARNGVRAGQTLPRRPDWRTLTEMLRVCEATAVDLNATTQPRRDRATSESKAPLSIGVGIVRGRFRHMQPFAVSGPWARLVARLRALI